VVFTSSRRKSLQRGAAALLFAVAASGSYGAGIVAAGASKKPVTIGISLSLSGDFSSTGQAGKLGYELWASQVNAHGGLLGRPVVLDIASDASTPNQAVTNYENFITHDHVTLLAGPYSSLLSLPSAKIANRYHYLFVEGAGNGPAVFSACLPNLVYAGAPSSSTAAGLVWARYILSLPKSKRPKTAAYPDLNTSFSLGEANAIQRVFQKHGIRTVYKTIYPAEEADLSGVMEAVKAANPTMVVSGTQDTDGFAQVKAALDLKFSPKYWFMANGPENPVEFPATIGKKNVTGFFTAIAWTPTVKYPGNAQFVQAYLKKFGGKATTINSTAAETYSVGQAIQVAVQETNSLTNNKLSSYLHHHSFTTVAAGTIQVDKCGEPHGNQDLAEWVNGKIVLVFPKNIAQHAPIIPKPAWKT
jgi:branched-chain amino acid transport system substrate-binding protein